jgi:hypothetical protein
MQNPNCRQNDGAEQYRNHPAHPQQYPADPHTQRLLHRAAGKQANQRVEPIGISPLSLPDFTPRQTPKHQADSENNAPKSNW